MRFKDRIIDIIFFGGDIDLLEMRLSELSDEVSNFIIIESIPELLKNNFNYDYKPISKWLPKIKIYSTNVDINSSDQEPELKLLLEEIIYELDLNFTDILMFSKYNEIPDFSLLDEIIEELDFGPIIFRSPCLSWSVNYVEKHEKFGTFIFLFSHFITKEINFLTLFRDKSNIVMPKYSKIHGGWILEGFEKNKKVDPYLIENYLPNSHINPLKTYQLVKIESEIKLPKNIFKLNSKQLGRDYSKLHFFDCDNSNDNPINDNIFDTIIKINFSNNPIESIEYDKNLKFVSINTFLPKKVLYGIKPYSEFIEDYKFNEVIKFCYTIFPLDQDKIFIKMNGVITEYLWEELKKNPLN